MVLVVLARKVVVLMVLVGLREYLVAHWRLTVDESDCWATATELRRAVTRTKNCILSDGSRAGDR